MSYFSFRGNTSIGSNRFLLAEHIGQNSAAITVQDNKILDTVQANAISDNNVGPLFLIDNVIRSRPGASGPAVTMDTGWAPVLILFRWETRSRWPHPSP